MGDLVADHVGDALELDSGRLAGVHEEGRLAEGDAAEVLHGAESEVGDRDQVELVAGVGEVEVLREEAQGVRRDVERDAASGAPRPGTWTTLTGTPSTLRGSVASSGPTMKATR